jgi:hypothetical protein
MTEKEKKRPLTFTLDEGELTDLEYQKSLDEFFGDEEAIEYRVERIRPKGEGIEGYLGMHSSPFTFEDLRTLYGGGVYRIVKQKAGGGKAALLGAKTVTVAGVPKVTSQDNQDRVSPHEDLRAEIRALREEINKPKGNTVFTPDFVQELVTAKLLLDKGNNGGNNNELIKLLVASGDKKFEGLLEGIELAKTLDRGDSAEAEPSSWIEKLGSMVAQYLERKSVEVSTVKRSPQGTDGAQIKVTPTTPNPEPEQMLFQNLIDEVTDIVLDGIEHKIPAAEAAAEIKTTTGSFLLALVNNLSLDQMLGFLESRYGNDPDFMTHLKNPDTRIYLTQILEELKK